jgi:hypothetical protein
MLNCILFLVVFSMIYGFFAKILCDDSCACSCSFDGDEEEEYDD